MPRSVSVAPLVLKLDPLIIYVSDRASFHRHSAYNQLALNVLSRPFVIRLVYMCLK